MTYQKFLTSIKVILLLIAMFLPLSPVTTLALFILNAIFNRAGKKMAGVLLPRGHKIKRFLYSSSI